MNALPVLPSTAARRRQVPVSQEAAPGRDAASADAASARLERLAVRFAEASLVGGLAGLGMVALMLAG